MKLTKFGHCCLLIEEGELRLLTDPGIYSNDYEQVRNLDLVLITHEHADHFHLDALKAVIAANPQAKIVTNNAVGKLLAAAGLAFEVLEDSQSRRDKDVVIEGIGTEHAEIYPTIPNVVNTGYFIGNKLFYPGDALTHPERQIDILALPVAGPWMKVSEAVDYVRALKPKIWIPVHDGILKSTEFGFRIPSLALDPLGLQGTMVEQGKEIDL